MAEQDATPVFQIQRMYLKDMSLEQPNSPQILLEQQQPHVDINLGLAAEAVTEGVYEVCVTATVTTKVGDKTAFLVEAKQGGIFEMRNIPAEQMELLLNVICPNIVYPYLRSNVADTVQRTGFPPIHLAEINFEALYQQRLAQQKAESQGPGIILPGGAH